MRMVVFAVVAGLAAASAVAQTAPPRASSGTPQAQVGAPQAAGDSQASGGTPVAAATSDARRQESLPVKRVVLYKNGVGYFEHLGRVRGNGSVSIDFTSDQLNDALKSLTALDLGSGRITGIGYNSQAPLSQRLSSLNVPFGDATNITQFYGALRGARLEVRGPSGAFVGRLLTVERRTRLRGEGQSQEVDELSVVTDAGEVHQVELSPAVTVRLADRELTDQVGKYLGVVATAQQQTLRRMTISTTGNGERPLFVSYVSEVPIWKTTYRLVIPSKAGAKPFLQGWAVVDNTVGEDWTGVEMSLVAGEPQSFIQQISQPYYARRPVVPLPSSAMLAPQTYEGAMTKTDTSASSGGGGGRGVVGGVVNYPMAAPSPPPPPAPAMRAPAGVMRESVMDAVAVSDALADQRVAAQGKELGDLFEYRIKEPVTIRKNQSALVPIVNGEIGVEKVSLWTAGRDTVPLRAVWLDNSTGLTLDGGSITVLESEAFAGEGLLAALKPGERRLLSYAADTGLRVDAKSSGNQGRVDKIQVNRGVLIQVSQDEDQRTYTVRNDDKSPRTLVIEHPIRSGWTLAADTSKPAETSTTAYRFRVPVDAKKTATLTVREVYPRQTRYSLVSTSSDQLALVLRSPGSSPALEAALKPLIEKKQAIAAIDREIAARKSEIDRINTDQSRVRENMKALKGSAEERALVQRYTKQLDEQETRLEALQKELSGLDQRRAQAQAELEKAIEAISI
jgi:hypothetical protein